MTSAVTRTSVYRERESCRNLYFLLELLTLTRALHLKYVKTETKFNESLTIKRYREKKYQGLPKVKNDLKPPLAIRMRVLSSAEAYTQWTYRARVKRFWNWMLRNRRHDLLSWKIISARPWSIFLCTLQLHSYHFHCEEAQLRSVYIYGARTPNACRWRNKRQTCIPFLTRKCGLWGVNVTNGHALSHMTY
jgi:hypothetical protein